MLSLKQFHHKPAAKKCKKPYPVWMTEESERLSTQALAKLFPRIDTSYTSRIAAKFPETHEKVRERSGQTARCLATEFFPEDILLVAHGASVLGAAMGLVGEIAKTEVKASLCSLVKVVRQEPEWLLELTGDTSHLTHIEEVKISNTQTMNPKEFTDKQSQLECFSGSQAGLVNQTAKKNEMGEEAQSIIPTQIDDKPKSELHVNPDIHVNQEFLLQKFQQLCQFWHPILGTSAAIVTLLVKLFQLL
jgi:Histidine phosphatase superfamily (branch 1)